MDRRIGRLAVGCAAAIAATLLAPPAALATPARCHGLEPTIVGTPGRDQLTGTRATT